MKRITLSLALALALALAAQAETAQHLNGLDSQGKKDLVTKCPSSYKMGHESVLSIGGSGSFV